MARRDDLSLGQKQRLADKGGPAREPEQEQAQDHGADLDRPEASRAQDLFGNATLAAALAGVSVAGAAGVDGNLAVAREPGQEGPELGGDDDDGAFPLTLDDLVRDWDGARSARRSGESTTFVEPMPHDDLPEADAAWLLAVRSAAAPVPPSEGGASSLDGLLQPSELVFAGPAMRGWVTEASRWGAGDLVGRALAATLAGSAPFLQDPWGRVGNARARAGAAATLLVLDGPALGGADPWAAALLQLCLELAGGRRRVDQVHEATRARGDQLPLCAAVLAHHLPTAAIEPPPLVPTDGPASSHLSRVIGDILAVGPAHALVPDLPDRPGLGTDPDDPLGLDEVLAQHTGGRPDLRDGAYQAALVAAEHLAGTTALLRVRTAGCAVAIADAAALWLSRPLPALAAVADGLDRDSKRVLSLVVEVARAGKARSVEPEGVRNGLLRAARMLDRLREQVVSRLSGVATALLRERGPLHALAPVPDDAFGQALADGRPAEALALVRASSAPTSAEAAALLEALVHPAPGRHGPRLLEAARDLRAAGRPSLATAVEVCAGPVLLAAGRAPDALDLADRHLKEGWRRRNGLLVASAGLLAMDAHRLAGDPALEARARDEAGRRAYHLGAAAAVTALARWAPPEA